MSRAGGIGKLELEVRRVRHEEQIATFGPVLIRVFRNVPTEIPELDLARELLDELSERWPVIGVWAIAHHGAPIPDGPTRRRAKEVFGRYGDKLVLVQSVVGLGFWAAAGTATGTAIARLLGISFPIENSVEAGAERLAMEMVGLDPQELIVAHDELFRRIEAEAAS
jgi:hypothetical protein